MVRQISEHPIVKDEKFPKMLLRANFGSDPATSISFSSFLPGTISPGTLPTYSASCDFLLAAASFEIAARVYYSEEFLKAMDSALLILSGPQTIVLPHLVKVFSIVHSRKSSATKESMS